MTSKSMSIPCRGITAARNSFLSTENNAGEFEKSLQRQELRESITNRGIGFVDQKESPCDIGRSISRRKGLTIQSNEGHDRAKEPENPFIIAKSCKISILQSHRETSHSEQ
jgi:hypothetical protein